MHDAYDLCELLKLALQIDSIAAYDNNLLVGTKQGHLLIYSVERPTGEHKPHVQLLCYNKTFSKKPIQQLEVIPAYQLLISLSDNIVSVYNIQKEQTQTKQKLLETLQKTKGATLFTLDVQNQKSLTGGVGVFVRLCVVVKKKLQFYYWKNGSFLELQPDVTVTDVPRSLSWHQNTLCIGYKGEYVLLTLSTGKTNPLFPVGKAPEPSITKLGYDVFALVKDSQSIFINSKGDPTCQYAVKWPEVPVALGYDDPYLLALLPESIQIKTVEPNLFIQSVEASKVLYIAYCKRGLLYIASETHVWCLQAVPISQQIKTLLEEKHFQLALKLANTSDECEEDKKKNINEIQTLYAYHLFESKQFQESMKQFLALKTDPYNVIKLFPELLPNQSKDQIGSSSKLSEKEMEVGLLALVEYLTEVRHNLMDMKASKQKGVNASLSIIDTTLLQCYLQTNDALVAPLLRLNMVNFNEAERLLKKHKKISELVILYQAKGYHFQALVLLKQQPKDLDKMIQYLQQLGTENSNLIFEFADWVISEDPQQGLKIFIGDATELEQLPRQQVLHHLLKKHEELAVPYLEHVIGTWKDNNPFLHTTLVQLYKRKYQDLSKSPESKQEAQKVREKLIRFLETSRSYAPQNVLSIFPNDDMFEERAIILGKLGRHEQALSIYICILRDVARAKKYCEQVYSARDEGSKEVFALLMRILISPPENWLGAVRDPHPQLQPDLETALNILQEHADKIDPIQAISVLPDSVPILRIRNFLLKSLQNNVKLRRTTQMMKGLVYAEHLHVQDERMRNESKSVLMTEVNLCPVCRKRFTNQSAFARFPGGEVVHYGCQKEKKT